MFAIRQIIEDPQEVISIPLELRHRRTEVIFIALDSSPENEMPISKKHTLKSLAGCWEGETIERAPQGDYEIRRDFE
jgi:hypothetical protein